MRLPICRAAGRDVPARGRRRLRRKELSCFAMLARRPVYTRQHGGGGGRVRDRQPAGLLYRAPPREPGAEDTSEVFCLVTSLLDPGGTRRWTGPAPAPCGGPARPSSVTARPTLAKASPSCARAARAASCRRCGHCSPSTRAICQITGIAVNAAGIPPDRISFPHALA